MSLFVALSLNFCAAWASAASLQWGDDYPGGSSFPPLNQVTTSQAPPNFPGSYEHACGCGQCKHNRVILTNYRFYMLRDKDRLLPVNFLEEFEQDDVYFFETEMDFGKGVVHSDSYDCKGYWLVKAIWVRTTPFNGERHACGMYLSQQWSEYVCESKLGVVTLTRTETSGSSASTSKSSAPDGPERQVGFGWSYSVSTGGTASVTFEWTQTKLGPVDFGQAGSEAKAPCTCGKKPKADDTTKAVGLKQVEKIKAHLNDFDIGAAEVPILAETKSIVIETRKAGDDMFASAESVAVVIGEKPVDEAVKTDMGRWTADWDKLKEAGASGLMTSLSGTEASAIQYVSFVGASGIPASIDPSQPTISRIRPVTGGGAPNFTAAGGRTAPMAVDGSFDATALAVGAERNGGLVPVARFEPDFVVTQNDAAGRTLLKTAVGAWRGEGKDLAAINRESPVGVLNEAGEFIPESIQKLADVVPAGAVLAQGGPLRSPVNIEPKVLKVNDPYVVTTAPAAGDLEAFAAAKGVPVEIVRRHIKVNLSVDGKVVKSGVLSDGPLTHNGTAPQAEKVLATTTLEWVGADTFDSELRDYGDRLLKSTGDERSALPTGLSKALEKNVRSRFSSAPNRESDR